jgi:nucleotide-binding universal stress UspA family protein
MSNPRRPQGAFFDCFHKDSEYWNTRFIDSRSVEGTDKSIYQKIIDKHGEDSDVARVEVKGQFPRTGSNQLIGFTTVEEAASRTIKKEDVAGSAKILGIDVARFGDDLSTIQKRQGLIAFEPIEFSKVDNMELASTVANVANQWKADAIIIGSGGGQGVIDRLRQLGFNVLEVDEGGSADRKDLYLNKRIEMWDNMLEWLLAGGVIPNHERLKEDLSSPMYAYTPTSSKKVLESVEAMKKRGLPSPDFGTSLALTFSVEIAPTMVQIQGGMGKVVDKFDPFSIPATK